MKTRREQSHNLSLSFAISKIISIIKNVVTIETLQGKFVLHSKPRL